ncbi:hypothetical protein TNCT_482651 [Trichonephila clavata]|uniref:Uncharacterized protein n=1 Tax=Trichonephila clavata TaxID=2740835 RepID=A0A8X6HFF6_TRICU|nr:hypothetical protein TNCT_482651 [Trichonephila clavata]
MTRALTVASPVPARAAGRIFFDCPHCTSTSNYVDPNVCDSDTRGQTSSFRTPSLPIIIPRPLSGSHQESSRSSEDNVVSSQERYAILHELVNNRTHPGGYPSRIIQWWNRVHSSPSGLRVIDEGRPHTVPEASRTINRRNWRRQLDSDSSLELTSSDEEDYPVHPEERTSGGVLPVSRSLRVLLAGTREQTEMYKGEKKSELDFRQGQNNDPPNYLIYLFVERLVDSDNQL